jgi:D-3-phosphoglycerate dehydrogenase / 2-oxoglutarate reductase
MSDAIVEALIFDLLEWLASGRRSYEDVMAAWRTSCPKLPVWEDATDRGFVTSQLSNGGWVVRITPAGFAHLKRRGNHYIAGD